MPFISRQSEMLVKWNSHTVVDVDAISCFTGCVDSVCASRKDSGGGNGLSHFASKMPVSGMRSSRDNWLSKVSTSACIASRKLLSGRNRHDSPLHDIASPEYALFAWRVYHIFNLQSSLADIGLTSLAM